MGSAEVAPDGRSVATRFLMVISPAQCFYNLEQSGQTCVQQSDLKWSFHGITIPAALAASLTTLVTRHPSQIDDLVARGNAVD